MIRDGFEYVAAGRRAVEPSPEARRVADLTDEEFASLYGFGFSTLIDLDPLGLIREDIAPDPNATIREAMSEPELSAYADRLTRCRQQAYEQLPAPPGGFALSAETDAVLEEIETMVTSDRRFVAAVDTYRRCMADEGLQFDSREHMFQTLAERSQPYIDTFMGTWNALARRADYDAIDRLRIADVLSESELADLAQVQAFEVEVAQADLACAGDVQAVSDGLYREYLEEYARTP